MTALQSFCNITYRFHELVDQWGIDPEELRGFLADLAKLSGI